MTQPTAYYPAFNFTQYQVSHPSTPLPGASVDSELFDISVSVTEICNNLALIQRDDGALANLSVGNDQLKTEVAFGFNTIANWVTGHAYVLRDGVYQGNNIYRCQVAHTSTVFATDLAAGFWVLVADFNTPITAAAASATAAAGSATSASGSATASAGSATLASQWASQTSGIVAATDYSAKEFAQGSQAATGGSAKNWAMQTGADVTGAAVNSRSAKSWAQDAIVGATLGGSAKDWAQSASLPDGTSKSAKSYAADAAASATAASTSAAGINQRYCGTSTGLVNALTLTPSTAAVSYTNLRVTFFVNLANTTEAVTANVSALGIKNVKKVMRGVKTNLAIGELQLNTPYEGQYDGTDLVVLNPGDTKSSDIASASTVDLTAAAVTGNFANLTGVVTVNALTLPIGKRFLLRHTGVHILTHSATLFLLNNAQNITTAVGDLSEWVSDGTNVYMTRYERAAGQPLSSGGTDALHKNWIVNGGMRVAQRPTFAISSGAYNYGAVDRMKFAVGGTSPSGTLRQNNFLGFETGWCWQVQNLNSTGAGNHEFRTFIESKDSVELNSKTVTLSVRVEHDFGSNVPCYLTLYKATAIDNFAALTTLATSSGSPVSVPSGLNTTSTLLTLTYTMGASDGNNGLDCRLSHGGLTGVVNKNIAVGDFKLEIGTVVTSMAVDDFEEQLRKCKRFYEKSFDYATAPAQFAATNGEYEYVQVTAAGSAGIIGGIRFMVDKLVIPAITLFNPLATNAQARNLSTSTDCNTTSAVRISTTGFAVLTTTVAGSAVGNTNAIQYAADGDF